jgi:hypothetical protein
MIKIRQRMRGKEAFIVAQSGKGTLDRVNKGELNPKRQRT